MMGVASEESSVAPTPPQAESRSTPELPGLVWLPAPLLAPQITIANDIELDIQENFQPGRTVV